MLCAAMLASIAACGGGGAQTTTAAATTAAAAAETTAAAAVAETTAAAVAETTAAKAAVEETKAAAEATTAAIAVESADEHLEINFFHWGDKPNQMDDVIAYFNETGGKELNMTWKNNWTPLDDYSNMIKLKIAAGEPVDACFDAQWMMLIEFIREGNYHDMTPYYLNPAYPGLMNAFDANFLNNNQFGSGKNYSIPLTQSYDAAPLVFIRGDLREQYGVPVVNTLEDYEVFLEAIKENEPNMIPLTTNTKERHTDTIVNHNNALGEWERVNAGVWTGIQLASGMNAVAYVKDYQLIACALTNEPASAYADFPEPYNQRNMGMDSKLARFARDYYERGFLDPDFINVTSMSGVFTSGKAASMIWDTANYLSMVNTLKLALPDATVEVFQPSPIYREGIKGKKYGNFLAWNHMCVPVTTSPEKFDRVMQFFDWMFSSWDNHDLIELGIPGVNFVAVGDSQFKLPDGVDPATNYNLPGYQLTWNPNFSRLSADMPPDVLLYNQRGNDPETYYDPMFSGFSFNAEGLENELANPDFATFKDRADNIRWGIIPNVDDAFAALDADFESNKALMEDIAKIKAELVIQIQEYLPKRQARDAANGVKW
jgi:putative aldouronate transport system substrate-binding protein